MNKIDEDKINYIRLINTDGVGSVLFFNLLKKYKTPQNVLDFLQYERKLNIFPKNLAEEQFELAEKIGAKIIFFCDEDYPFLLKQIYDVPPLIYVRGNIDTLNTKSIAVVGSRNASINSKHFTTSLSRQLVDNGFCVVSGMAIGIDTEAHLGALSSIFNKGKQTIAVLAGGVDNIYPLSNRNLYNQIIDNGAVISEMRIGTQPQANLFPKRNRIISGLSLGTLVMEASLKSGSLITARFAMEQAREVFAVPNFPMDPRSSGTNDLIRNGATLVTNVDDILDTLNKIKEENIIKTENRDLFLNEEFNDAFVEDDFDFDNMDLDNKILSLLNNTPISIDSLIRELSPQFSQAKISNALLKLELDDKISYPSTGKIILKL